MSAGQHEPGRGSDGGAPAPRVLIVDDDPSIRTMLGFLFEDEGFVVLEAADGREAVSALESDPPDAMVLDLMMPVLDGHAVLRVRNELGLAPNTRIVVLTSKTEASDAVWCWELGADDFVAKPVDPEVLLRDVQGLLRETASGLAKRRADGLAEAKRLDAMEAVFDIQRRNR